MKSITTKWACDNPKCGGVSCGDYDMEFPGDWFNTEQDNHYCSQSCLDSCQSPWYADLCVEVTLMDAVSAAGTSVENAIHVAARKITGMQSVGCHSQACSHVSLNATMAIEAEGGRVYKSNKSNGTFYSTTHSIVKLICPTFSEACEHPAAFLAMYYAAHGVHAHLSEAAEMEAIAIKFDDIANAIRAASDKAKALAGRAEAPAN